jgi:hypothetical protein
LFSVSGLYKPLMAAGDSSKKVISEKQPCAGKRRRRPNVDRKHRRVGGLFSSDALRNALSHMMFEFRASFFAKQPSVATKMTSAPGI